MEVKLSAVIICFNEERNIARCIESVQGLVDEVLVLDSFSKDRTPEICRELGVRFEQHAFDGHIQQKNRAMRMAQYDHVLSLDADEALDDTLQQEVVRAKKDWQGKAYKFNRLTNYCGTWIRHCGWYPDTKTRLWDRRHGEWGGENPHDKVLMEPGTKIRHLRGDLLHYSFYTIEQHLDTIEKFSTIKANNKLQKGRTSNVLQLYLHPVGKFLKMYLWYRGFLDGKMGWHVCWNSGYSAYLKHLKVRKAKA